MTEHVPDPTTSRRMAGIRQRGTKYELLVGAALRELGLHYRKNVRSLPGSPDFANRSGHWAIFVNGCFWHHHTNCRKATTPKSNTEFWMTKFRDNRRRDALAVRSLRKRGFKVKIVWECEVRDARAGLAKLLESRGINAR